MALDYLNKKSILVCFILFIFLNSVHATPVAQCDPTTQNCTPSGTIVSSIAKTYYLQTAYPTMAQFYDVNGMILGTCQTLGGNTMNTCGVINNVVVIRFSQVGIQKMAPTRILVYVPEAGPEMSSVVSFDLLGTANIATRTIPLFDRAQSIIMQEVMMV
jgi:hypothetical protein